MRVVALLLCLASLAFLAEAQQTAPERLPAGAAERPQSGATPAPAAVVPRMQGRINDYANLLSEQQRTDLDARLAVYEGETSHQIAVLTVLTLSDEPIESFSLRVANAWRLGRRGLGNGVLLTVAPAERKARIELGRGMSQYVPDALAAEIIDSVMIPQFRARQYAHGIELGVERLMIACRAYRVGP